MKVDPDTEIVQRRLMEIGYAAEPIDRPGPNGKSADLWAYADSDRLVVEVKSRIDDAETAAQLGRAAVGEIIEREGDLARKNRLSGVVEEASRQIADSQHAYDGRGVFWFRATPNLGFDDSEHQMQATLLGIRSVGWMRGDDSGAGWAIGATFSDFYRFRNLDATVLEVEGRGRLILNPYSPTTPALTRTKLFQYFADSGAALAIGEMSVPTVFVVDGDVDRGDENAVRRALCQKYPGYKFVLFDMKSYGLVARVDLTRSG